MYLNKFNYDISFQLLEKITDINFFAFKKGKLLVTRTCTYTG